MAEILILIHGMGESKRGDCFAWASRLFPDGKQYTKDTRRWVQLSDGRQVYLLEVYYEDLNELMRTKHEELWKLFKGSKVTTYVSDVFDNVLRDEHIDGVQSRFVAKYLEAREIARALVGAAGDPSTVRIGVLAHSLGTLVAYEGLHRAADVASAFEMLPVNLVVCAPMWTPMQSVLKRLGRRRYLVHVGLTKPGRINGATGVFEPLIRKCTAIYDLNDPFWLIQNGGSQYDPGPDNSLIDSFVRIGTQGTPDPRKHSIVDHYLVEPASRDAVLAGLFV